MEKTFQRILGSVAMMAMVSSAFAGGSGNPLPGGGGLDEIAGKIEINPIVQGLATEFHRGAKPSEVNEHGSVIIGKGIQEGIRYNCRSFFALTKSDMATGPESKTWYQFVRFGLFVLDNEGFLDTGRVKNYGVMTSLNNEVWGQAPSKDFYEAIRVVYNGDIIIESFAPEMAWIRTVLGPLGLEEQAYKLLEKLRGLGMMTSVLGAAGYITNYTYCPKSAQEPARRPGTFFVEAKSSADQKIDEALFNLLQRSGKGYLVNQKN